MPGLPMLPFLALSGLAGSAAWFTRNGRAQASAAADAAPAAAPAEPPISESLRIDMIRVELGYALLALAGGDQPRLTEQIKGLRRAIAGELGFVLPPVRIQDNMQLPPETYCIRVKEIEAGRGEIRPDEAAGDGSQRRRSGPAGRADPGTGAAIVAMALILPSLVGVFWLSFQIPRQFANRKSLRTAGVSATAKIDKVVSARGSQLWVKYTFEAEGRTITNETEAPKSLEGVLYQAETINIRYLPSDPEINHPSEWEWSLWSESIWIAVFVWAIPGFILLLRIGKRAGGPLIK